MAKHFTASDFYSNDGSDPDKQIDLVPTTTDRGYPIQMFSGKYWYPHDPQPDDVTVADLISLGNICRFAGQTDFNYSVAQHSILVGALVKESGGSSDDILAALLHDAHEAYPPNDVGSPLKRGGSMFAIAARQMEEKARRCVMRFLGLPADFCDRPIVRKADMLALSTEKAQLLCEAEDQHHWGDLPAPREDIRIPEWSPRFSAQMWVTSLMLAEWPAGSHGLRLLVEAFGNPAEVLAGTIANAAKEHSK